MDQPLSGARSSSVLIRRIFVSCFAVVLIALVARNMLVQIAVNSHVSLGLSKLVWPSEGALDLLDENLVVQDIDWKKHDPNTVFAVASEAHRLDPLDNWPFMLAGSMFERIGDTEKAITLFERSVRLDPRSPAPRLHLIKNLIEARRANDAVTQIVRLARLRPDQDKLLLKALVVLLVRDPEHKLISRLNAYPDVRKRFLAQASQVAEAEPFMTELLNQPGVDKQIRWDQIDRLAQRGSIETAYAIWRRSPDAQKSGNVFDPHFQGRPGPAAFRWQLINNSGVVAEFTHENAAGPVALDVEVFSDTIVEATQQTVRMAPGSHRLTIVGKAIDVPEIGGTMRWDVSCAGDDRPLARIVFAMTAKPATKQTSFSIPASGCAFQNITLSGIPEVGSQPFRMRFSRIAID
ncbi:hypothetical protein FSZ31_05990 [Sphingorhabdus soli]|uniref:Uncharacterized protein n=1 Tax=Flavisphingopyxis soli TaxID=2601267 RepID=A0A5C6ULU0_9SPHN|nr:tetratricopeptide repeat protein [Sphingorhabdus soli]TXC74252.1 hypothetical protein FSZ31_05990 [Sphingorhabdus soli]